MKIAFLLWNIAKNITTESSSFTRHIYIQEEQKTINNPGQPGKGNINLMPFQATLNVNKLSYKKVFMVYPYRLPLFMDYLHVNYQRLYELYLGKLTELFPSFDPNDENLLITEDETTTRQNNELILRLWKTFSR